MIVHSKSIYIINYEEEKVESRVIPETLNNIIEKIISEINENTSTRKYKPRFQTTQVISLIKQITVDKIFKEKQEQEIEVHFQEIAQRLLHIEIEMQKQIDRLGKQLKKGSLIQALLQDEQSLEYFYIIAKVEHSDWIDDMDFTLKTGFPRNKRNIWKSSIFELINDGEEIIVDSAKIYLDGVTKYWHHNFLEVNEMINDEVNTKTAFKNIEIVLTRSLKGKAPNDFAVLRNSVIGYMRTSRQINYNEMINFIFNDYEANEITIEELKTLKEKLYELPEKKKFDTQFNSVPSALKARIRKTYQVNASVEIKITDHVGDFKETIQAVEDADGKRFIKIRTTDDVTFKTFKS